MKAVKLTSYDLESGLDYDEECKQALCSSSLSLPRGRAQKKCQLIWLPLLPAVALLITSSVYLVIDVHDYTRKTGHLHDSKDIEVAASCLESIRRIQTLRYTSTLYLSSGSPVDSFERFVDEAFSAAAEVLLPADDLPQQCDFVQLIKEYFSEINFGQIDTYIDKESLKKFCTLKVFILETLDQLRDLTIAIEKNALRRVSLTFRLLIDLMHVDCIKYVAYHGNRVPLIHILEQYHVLVELEKVHSRMLSSGALYFSRGYLEKSDRRAMLADLRLADDYVRFSQFNVAVPSIVRMVVNEVLGDKNGETATSFGLARWTKVMQAYIGDLDRLIDKQLVEMKRTIDAEKSNIGWNVEFAVFAWIALFLVMLPIMALNATRSIASLRDYGMSCADKELQLRREKHKSDALLQEMLPRYGKLTVFSV